MNLPIYKKIVYTILAPFFIFVWCLMNPKKVWEQAKIDWKRK